MNIVFLGLLAIGIVLELVTCGGDAVLQSLTNGTANAVTLCITLLGAYLFWMGVLRIAKEAKLMQGLARLLRPCMRFLFPDAGEAQGAISMNLAANMLGMGNAATPYGLQAMEIMEAHNPRHGVATNAMCVLLAINASCLELFPATLVALRQTYGSAHPASVVLPTFLSSACATLVAVVACRLCIRRT